MKIAYISKKDLVTRFKCFIFQPYSMAPSHIPSLRYRCKGDGWFDAIYPCSQEIMFPSLRCRQVQSWIMCLAFLEPQPPLMLVHSFPIPALTCPPGGKLPHHLFPSLSHTPKQKETPQPHPLSLVRLLPSIPVPHHPSRMCCPALSCAGTCLSQRCPQEALILIGASTGALLSCSIQWWARACLERTHLKYTCRKSVKE